jgi:hypothetical protein
MTCTHKNIHKHDGICSNYQKHKDSQDQRLKEMSKSYFQIKNRTRLKNKNIITKNKNMICAR